MLDFLFEGRAFVKMQNVVAHGLERHVRSRRIPQSVKLYNFFFFLEKIAQSLIKLKDSKESPKFTRLFGTKSNTPIISVDIPAHSLTATTTTTSS